MTQIVMSTQGQEPALGEGGGLWGGRRIMNRRLPDVEVREGGTSHRRNIVYETQSSLQGGGGGVAKKTSGLVWP